MAYTGQWRYIVTLTDKSAKQKLFFLFLNQKKKFQKQYLVCTQNNRLDDTVLLV